MKKLMISIRSLDVGGAEKLVMELAQKIDKTLYDVAICTMYKGAMDEKAKSLLGENFVCLNKTGRYDFLSFFRSYVSFIRTFDPDVIYAHIGEMNLVHSLSIHRLRLVRTNVSSPILATKSSIFFCSQGHLCIKCSKKVSHRLWI